MMDGIYKRSGCAIVRLAKDKDSMNEVLMKLSARFCNMA